MRGGTFDIVILTLIQNYFQESCIANVARVVSKNDSWCSLVILNQVQNARSM